VAKVEALVSARRRWSDLSDRSRKRIIVGAVFEGILKVAALVDIKRRPADQIRGSKSVWAVVIVLVNSAGGAPLAYFLFGRRRVAKNSG
jgi:Phospholipase_D-nuclease N-terminal